ncbi:MAG: L-lactate permease [Anaerolineae bacterium]|nr:L-lactate permease [Anaerolineae bacterium]
MLAENNNSLQILLAALPMLVVLLLMLGLRWSGAKAGFAGWLVALALAILVFGAHWQVVLVSLVRAGLLAFYVLYIIIPGLFLYNLVKETGGIDVIAARLFELTPDPVLQLLLLAWVFSAFLEGVAGFGIPVAVVAPMLITAGFAPITAVVAVAIGHAWAVTFGSFGICFAALVTASQESAAALGPWSAVMIGLACLLTGLTVAHAFQGWRSLARALPAIILVGGAMAGSLYLLVANGLYALAGFGSGLAGLLVSVLVVRLPFYRANGARPPAIATAAPAKSLPLLQAALPYLLVLVIVLAAQFIPPIRHFFSQALLAVPLPQTTTRLGWVTPAGTGKVTSLLGDPGALMIYAIVISYILFRRGGWLQPGAFRRVLSATWQNAAGASLGILSMVALAMIMDQAGMSHALAVGLSDTLSSAYPLLSPVIGVLGVFVTGSNTNSNAMFAMLQKQSALLLHLAVPVILGAQTAGGAVGSMLAPAKIIVGCSTTGLTGQEGRVMRRTVVYGLLVALTLGVFAWLVA